jgi:hypothetical protein
MPACRQTGAKHDDTPVSGSQFAEARNALASAAEVQKGMNKGSQREEAMRKLNAAGVVPTKQAFSCKTSQSSQRTAALEAFQHKDGVDVSAGKLWRRHNQLLRDVM